MNYGWQLVIHEQAWDASETLRGREKVELRIGLEALLADPFQKPDAERRTPERTYSVKYIGRFCVLYWLDSFVSELRIVQIERENLK